MRKIKSTQNDEKVYNGRLRIKIYFRATAFHYKYTATSNHAIPSLKNASFPTRASEVYHNIKHHFIKFPLFNSLHLLFLSLPGT